MINAASGSLVIIVALVGVVAHQVSPDPAMAGRYPGVAGR
jgi:hypothetical protein